MTVDHDQPYKQLLNALENLDLARSLEALVHLSADGSQQAFAARLQQPGAYKIRGNRSKRNKFYDSLLSAPVMASCHGSTQEFAQDLCEKIRKIEELFDETRASLPQCDISKFPEDIQLWSHIERAARELKELDEKSHEAMIEMEELAKAGMPFTLPEMAIIKDFNGREITLEAAYSSIISTLGLTLKMLSYEQDLDSEGRMVAPPMPEISDDHVYKAGSIQLYASTWSSLEDVANRTLFFGGEIGSMEDAGLDRSGLPAGFYEKFPNPVVFNRRVSDLECFDFLANRRLHSWAIQNSYRLMHGTTRRIPVMAKGTAAPELSGAPFVSEEEGIALTTLSEILSFDVFSDPTRYHGLTLREWVRGYCALKLMTHEKQVDTALVTFEKTELEQGFKGFKIPEACVPALINHLTFGQGTRDLYDSPLICSRDDKYRVLADVLVTSSLPNVLLSRLSSLETQFDKKGQGFEDKVVAFFQSRDYQCKPAKFTIDGAQYEYDALLLVDETLFLIECKNTLLSGNHSVQALRYGKFIDDAVKQVKRLESGLYARPEIVEALFGRKLSDLTVVPVILNSMTYSRTSIDEVYVSDYSALSKFFDESTISEFHWENGEKKIRKVIARLWKGERPTSEELLSYLSFPPQLKLVMEHLTYNSNMHPTSEHSVFFSGVLDVTESALQKAKENAPAVD